MQSLSQNGAGYRTKCMTIEQAGAFARCLRGNGRFTSVEIAESGRAKGDRKWFVSFQPASEARQTALLDAQQTARARRACEQEFTFCLDKDTGRAFFWCHSHQSGEVYEVTEQNCSCPDYQFRCQPNKLACKHMLALRNAEPEAIRSW